VTTGLAFCQHHRRAFSILRHRSRWQNIGHSRANRSPCDLGHPATSLRSSTRRGLEGVLGLLPPDPGRLQSP
jgi:hypothetical protein